MPLYSDCITVMEMHGGPSLDCPQDLRSQGPISMKGPGMRVTLLAPSVTQPAFEEGFGTHSVPSNGCWYSETGFQR
ncbi:hypothetical protein cyc_04432 [Cyclospora cayetanensis]|uniref:Uncharacterized protein n=1 Tax=Cyclospora cayetanensis TaxID=88456 RepID=A0A1D3CR61_9EIME|nr:hypothetical protein cyc_04432 [Cyclospora cayetanensis]